MAQSQFTPTTGTLHSGCTTVINNNATDAETRLTAAESHAASTSNPHSVTKSQVGLGNVDNTSDVNKPISTATQTALDAKQATLVSGTSIKTVNGVSLLGSGDVAVATTSSARREFFPTIANNAADANNDIDFGASRVWVSNGTTEFLVDVAALTKRLDASWVAGNNNGGLDAGSKANSTWYYLHAIYNPTTLVSDYLLSASATSPTLPSGFTHRRRVGAVLTDSGGSIRAFTQVGNRVLWSTAITDFNASTRAASALTVSVPPISGIVWEGWVQIQGNAGESADARSLQVTNAIFCIARIQVSAQFASDSGSGLASNGQISFGSSAATACNLRTNGFIDLRVI